MLESQDILFIVLAFCALWFTAFVCWILYQIASLIKHLHVLVDDVRIKISELENAIIGMKNRFEGNLSLISGIADGVKKIIEALKTGR